jgi:hypothetical protein
MHIETFREHQGSERGLGTGTEIERAELLSRILDGTRYTALRANAGRWKAGYRIGTVTVEGETYLRVDSYPVAFDDLGILPEF